MIKLNKIITPLAITALSLGASNVHAQQPLKVPAPSPTQSLKQNFALSDVTIEYSRPSAKGRVVYGDLVPYGKIWRTGANASTKITFGDSVKVEGKNVPAGTYALYTIPNKESWEILLYKDLTLGGNTAKYITENELLRFTVKPTPLVNKVELFTINMADITASNASIELDWDKLRVAFKISSDIDARIMKNIEASMKPVDTRPYFQSASYYYENNKDLVPALEWINKAIEQNPKAFWAIMLKAKIQLRMKDTAGAIATAQEVISVAKEAQNDEYIKMAQKLIEEAKK